MQQFYFWVHTHWSEAGVPTDLRTPMFSAAVFALGRGGSRPKCPSMGRWTNKTWPGPAVEKYSALKRKDIVTQATRGRNPGDTLPSEISQSQQDQHCVIPLLGSLQESDT